MRAQKGKRVRSGWDLTWDRLTNYFQSFLRIKAIQKNQSLSSTCCKYPHTHTHTHTHTHRDNVTVPAVRWSIQSQCLPEGRSRSPWPSVPSAGSPICSPGLLARLWIHTQHTHVSHPVVRAFVSCCSNKNSNFTLPGNTLHDITPTWFWRVFILKFTIRKSWYFLSGVVLWGGLLKLVVDNWRFPFNSNLNWDSCSYLIL